MDIQKLLRPHLIGLKPYVSARSEYSGEGILLDANENALGAVSGGDFTRYPDPLQQQLKSKIVNWLDADLSNENIFCGNGSDEIIELIVRAFCEPAQDAIMVFPPVFSMYEKCAQINNVGIQRVNLMPSFQLDLEAIKAAITPQTKVIFVCTPNNPSGNLIHFEDIKILLDSFDGVFVIDEAYIDFTKGKSAIYEIDKYPNLLVLRTFSKAWGMAALRLGFAIGSKEMIHCLNAMKMPYNVNVYTQDLALKAFENLAMFENNIDLLNVERNELEKQISWLEFVKKVYPSNANYLLVKFEDAQAVYEYLIKEQIVVRDRSYLPHCEGCLRITVGSPEENKALLGALKNFKSV